jgi:hypothetical protein
MIIFNIEHKKVPQSAGLSFPKKEPWSRGESNPCPNNVTIGLLHAYCFIICRR